MSVNLSQRKKELRLRHAESVRSRFDVEWKIVSTLVQLAFNTGCKVTCNYAGEDYRNGTEPNEIPPTSNMRDIMAVMFETDEEYLRIYKDGECVGWIYLIYGNGNGGRDVISDYSANEVTEKIVDGTNAICEDV